MLPSSVACNRMILYISVYAGREARRPEPASPQEAAREAPIFVDIRAWWAMFTPKVRAARHAPVWPRSARDLEVGFAARICTGSALGLERRFPANLPIGPGCGRRAGGPRQTPLRGNVSGPVPELGVPARGRDTRERSRVPRPSRRAPDMGGGALPEARVVVDPGAGTIRLRSPEERCAAPPASFARVSMASMARLRRAGGAPQPFVGRAPCDRAKRHGGAPELRNSDHHEYARRSPFCFGTIRCTACAADRPMPCLCGGKGGLAGGRLFWDACSAR